MPVFKPAEPVLNALNQARFRSQVEDALETADSLTLDLTEVALIDSAGVSCLVSIHRKVSKAGKTCAIQVVPGQVEKTLVLTRLNRLFTVQIQSAR